MQLEGTVVKIFDEKEVSPKLKIKEFVIKTKDQYPQEIIMQVANQKIVLLDNITEGDSITAHINLRGRKSNKGNEDRWFNTIEAWKID